MKNKVCTKCKKEKPLEDFGVSPFTRNGKRAACKECCNKAARERYWKNPKKARTNARKRYKNNDFQKAKKRYRKKDLKKKFGMTVGEYDEMLKQQKGVCAICGRPEDKLFKGQIIALSIDHDHKTGQIRGLLCSHCNTMLGLARENTHILTRAISYLIQVKMP